MAATIIGKITATERKPTTYNNLRFWLADHQEVRIFDVVRIKHINNSYTYAIVTDLQFITDSAGHLANFVSSDFGNVDVSPLNERLGTTIADADVLYNSAGIEMPVRDGAQVETADADEVRIALGLLDFKHPIPAGYVSMSYGTEVPVDFEASYLLGPEGAHLNIAGISGLATKTSYAMFLLNAIQQKMSDQVGMILLNVKGSDLLAIDEKPRKELSGGQIKEWQKCGLEPIPFSNVKYLYPYAAKREQNCYSNTSLRHEFLEAQHRSGRAFNYYYDLDTMKDKMDLLFSDIDDPNVTLGPILDQIKSIAASSWDHFRSQIAQRTRPRQSNQGNVPVQSWRRFHRLLETRTKNPIFDQRSLVSQENKRQCLVEDAIRQVSPGQVLVIDIEPLPDYLQCLVVGDIISTIRNIKVGEDEKVPDLSTIKTVVIFADELNKYAPRSDSSGRSLTNVLLEVTERGRSLGIILSGYALDSPNPQLL